MGHLCFPVVFPNNSFIFGWDFVLIALDSTFSHACALSLLAPSKSYVRSHRVLQSLQLLQSSTIFSPNWHSSAVILWSSDKNQDFFPVWHWFTFFPLFCEIFLIWKARILIGRSYLTQHTSTRAQAHLQRMADVDSEVSEDEIAGIRFLSSAKSLQIFEQPHRGRRTNGVWYLYSWLTYLV